MEPQDRDFLCSGWAWDSFLRELRFYERKGKRWKEEPEQVERLRPVRSLTWHRWSQAPAQAASGQAIPGRLSRIVVQFEDGASMTINENDRECADKLASTLASAFGLEVVQAGAPGERRPSTVPQGDERGRLVSRAGRMETVVDPAVGEIVETKKRLGFITGQRRIQFGEVRRLELEYEVKGPVEEHCVTAVYSPEEQRVLVASYQGFEGWARREEWQQFAEGLARDMGGVEVVGKE